MSELVPFDFEGHGVRVVRGEDGEPWFVATDVARLLGYARPKDAVAAHCKGAAKRRLPTQEGGKQEFHIIPERDVYRLIMRSKLPAAERFEEWVVGEVLPSIRKTGAYGQAVDFKDLAKALSALGRYDRNVGLDLIRKALPTIPVGRFHVTVLPTRPAPSERTAAVLELLQQPSVPWCERAAAYAELVGDGYSAAEIATITGRQKRHVEKCLKMWRELSPGVLDLLRHGRLRPSHAEELLVVPHAAQDLAAKLIVKAAEGWRTAAEIRDSIRRARP